ncbi:HCP-like protein [Abortiporus biennis]|nr:HCP-like protein [Abortiporus biennis]
MTGLRNPKYRARKASFIAFGLIVLATVATAASANDGSTFVASEPEPHQVIDPNVEATRAYKQAMATLASLSDIPQPQISDYPNGYSSTTPASSSNTLLSSLLPNIQGQGPIASAMRIALKLRYQNWIPSSISNLFNREAGIGGGMGKRREEELRGRAVKVIDLLQLAAELGNTDALFTLGHISLFPPNTLFPSDPALSFSSFAEHAALTGNATSQSYLAFFHSTGYHAVTPVDQSKTQLYLTFAAHGGNKGAQMSMGYRYWSGIGVAENCMNALNWYEEAAEQAMAKFLSGPPGGRTLPLTTPRLSDLVGGVYGFGASVASTTLNADRAVIKTAKARAAGETWEDLLEYCLFNADRGEVDFAFRLGKIFYQGSIYNSMGGIASGGDGASAVPHDYHKARHYFTRIARTIWPSDPANPRQAQAPSKADNPPGAGYAALSAGYLGRMYLRGEGVRQDAAMAKMWFERGAVYGEKECHNGLGIIWRDGLVDGKKDMKKALTHFGTAATQELAEALVHLGKYHYTIGETKLATAYFEQAVRYGSPFEAYYYLAEIQSRIARSALTPPNIAGSACSIAVSFYKMVAEKGVWEDDLLRDAEELWKLGTERSKEMAMLRWWIAAERGFEVAQNNLAFVLDQDKSILRSTRFAPVSPSNDTARLALTQWIRSAAQRNFDALVKVGDYYYHGLGVADEPEDIRHEKAAGYYQSAADSQLSALAMWNLGWMYENGKGVPQDFHLAKRHYDSALAMNQEAYLPVVLSLVKLYLRSVWHTLLGGTDGLSLWPYGEEHGDSYYEEQAKKQEIEGGRMSDDSPSKNPTSDQYVDEEDGRWYLGKAREELNRRKLGKTPEQLDDPVQWARDRRNAENDRDGDFGPEDYFDAATRGAHRGEEEVDEFAETMLLVVLCITVSTLLFIRGRWVERMRREEQQQQQQQQQQGQQANGNPPPPAGGLYPPPGDPARDDWNVLR